MLFTRKLLVAKRKKFSTTFLYSFVIESFYGKVKEKKKWEQLLGIYYHVLHKYMKMFSWPFYEQGNRDSESNFPKVTQEENGTSSDPSSRDKVRTGRKNIVCHEVLGK